MKIDHKWDNANETYLKLRSILQKQGQSVAQVPERAIRRGVFELLARVQKLMPKVTSTLVRSVSAKVTKLSTTLIEGRVGTWLKYAPFVEQGTGIYGPSGKPFVVAAKTKRGLFWGASYVEPTYGEVRPLIVRKVTIKGMKPRAPFATAIAQFMPRYAEIVQQELAGGGKA